MLKSILCLMPAAIRPALMLAAAAALLPSGAALAQEEGGAPAPADDNPIAPLDLSDQPETGVPSAYPIRVDFDPQSDLDNVLLLDLSTGERVAIRLMPQWAPQHVARIKELAREGFYDGVVFHRVIDGFMAQTGDPSGTGRGGSQLPDLAAEFNPMPHVRGTVSMARSDAQDSANSQFFIVFYPRFALDRRYTNFGRVISNMPAVDAITRGEPPANPTRILQASIAADGKPQALPQVEVAQPVQISADMLSNSASD